MESSKNKKKSLGLSGALKVVAASAVLVVTGINLTGCNTTQGVGKDIESAGESLQDAAD